MVAVKKTLVQPPPLEPEKPWVPPPYQKTENSHVFPERAFVRFRQFADKVNDSATRKELADVIDSWWTKIYDGHPPANATFSDICLYISYELVLRDSQEHSNKLSEKFMVNYEATRIIFTDNTKAMSMLTDRSTVVFMAAKNGTLLGQRFSGEGEEEQMAVVRKPPPRLAPAVTVNEDGITNDIPPPVEPAASPPPRRPPPRLGTPPPRAKAKAGKIRAAKPRGKIGATTRVIQLLLERSHTDEEILATVQAEYPDRSEKNIKTYIHSKRADVNSGRFPQYVQDEKLVRLFRTEAGELTTTKP